MLYIPQIGWKKKPHKAHGLKAKLIQSYYKTKAIPGQDLVALETPSILRKHANIKLMLEDGKVLAILK